MALRGSSGGAISRLMILCFDTSGPYCATALLRNGDVLAEINEDMTRGQAERLMPLLEECLADGGAGWGDLEALAVGIGPGNFTGTRIAVSAARGLALGLGIPAVGVSAFEAVAAGHAGGPTLVVLAAPRGRAYVQLLIDGEPASDPRLIDPENPPEDLPAGEETRVIGHRAGELARKAGLAFLDLDPAEPAEAVRRIALVASRRLSDGTGRVGRPAPLYVRPADAAPPSDPPPAILDP